MIWALLKLAHWIWRRRFLNFVNIFSLFFFYLSFYFKRMEPFIWTNLNCTCIFGFGAFLLSPVGKKRNHSSEQTWIPFPQGCFAPSLVETGSLFLEKKIFDCIFAIFLVSPLGKGCVPSIEYAWIPLTQECFTPSFVEIGPVVLEKKLDENVQSLRQRSTTMTDKFWLEKITWPLTISLNFDNYAYTKLSVVCQHLREARARCAL